MQQTIINNLVWKAIAPLPFDGAARLFSPPYWDIVNGKVTLIYLLQYESQFYVSMVAYSFDDNGNYCTYQASNYSPGITGDSYCALTFFRSGNNFLAQTGSGALIAFTLPTVFQAGVTFTIPVNTFAAPPSPCDSGAALTDVAYLTNQGLIAYHYDMFLGAGPPQSFNFYLSVYDMNHHLLGAGRTGFETSTDNYNRLNLVLPINTQHISIKNGYRFYFNADTAPYTQAAYGWMGENLVGDYKQMQCDVTATNPPYLIGVNGKQISLLDNQLPPSSNDQLSLGSGLTDFPQIFAIPQYFGRSNPMVIVSPTNFVQVNQPPGLNCGGGIFTANKKLYWGSGNPYYMGGQLFVADFDFDITILPQVNLSHYNQLANYHRAVSPNGIFQA